MKTLRSTIGILILSFISHVAFSQEEIQTLFKHGVRGGYVGLSSKVSTIGNSFANSAELYIGCYINRKFFIGLGGSGTTNFIKVPLMYSETPYTPTSYFYGQAGLVNEFVVGSNKAAHLVFHLFNGAGYTFQYQRNDNEFDDWDSSVDGPNDVNCFFVTEPGIQVELNVFKWLRLSPGATYRLAFGSDVKGLQDKDLSGLSLNMTLKLGKF